jgi:hypothetical protein
MASSIDIEHIPGANASIIASFTGDVLQVRKLPAAEKRGTFYCSLCVIA